MKRTADLPIPEPKRRKTIDVPSGGPAALIPPVNTTLVAQNAQKRDYVGVFPGEQANCWFGLVQYRKNTAEGLREKRTGKCHSQEEAVTLVKALLSNLKGKNYLLGRSDYGNVISGTTVQLNPVSMRLRPQKKPKKKDAQKKTTEKGKNENPKKKRAADDDTPDRRSKRQRKQPIRYRQKYMRQQMMLQPESDDDFEFEDAPSKKRRTGYRGVSYNEEKEKWMCQIYKNHKISIGYFQTAKKAAKTYDKTLLKLLGAEAKLNFPKKSLKNISESELRQDQGLEEVRCMICQQLDDEGFLLCENMEGGDHGGHFRCFGLGKVPDGDWFCTLHQKCDDVTPKPKPKPKKKLPTGLPPPVVSPAPEVDEILNVRNQECLVKWKGLGFASATWEPIHRFKKHAAMERYISRVRRSNAYHRDPATTVVVQSNAYQRPSPMQQRLTQPHRRHYTNPLTARSNENRYATLSRSLAPSLGIRETQSRPPVRGPVSGMLSTHRNAPPQLENISHQQLADHVNSITNYQRPTTSVHVNRQTGMHYEVRNGHIPKTMFVPVDLSASSKARQCANMIVQMPPLEKDTPMPHEIKSKMFEPTESNSKEITVEPNNVNEWGTGLDYGRAVSKWEITKIKMGAQFHKLGVQPGWILMEVNNIPLLEKNRRRVEQILRSGGACKILFRTDLVGPHLEEPNIKIGERVLLKETVRLRQTLENPVLDPRGVVTQIWVRPKSYEYRVQLSDNRIRGQLENQLVRIYEDDQMKKYDAQILKHKINLHKATTEYTEVSNQVKILLNRRKQLVMQMNNQQKQLEDAQGRLLSYGVHKGEVEAHKEREEARRRQQKKMQILHEKLAAETKAAEEEERKKAEEAKRLEEEKRKIEEEKQKVEEKKREGAKKQMEEAFKKKQAPDENEMKEMSPVREMVLKENTPIEAKANLPEAKEPAEEKDAVSHSQDKAEVLVNSENGRNESENVAISNLMEKPTAAPPVLPPNTHPLGIDLLADD